MSTNAEMLRCVQRELGLRKHVYPGFVARGKMSVLTADAEIRAMTDIVEHFRALVDKDQRDLFHREGLS